ncbi:MAG: hypothetical protein WCG08_17040 [Paludibacter sp.]
MDEQEKREKQKSYNERFVRWQQLTIGQFSLTNNLFLSLNLGFLGFLLIQVGLSFSRTCWIFLIQVFTILCICISFIAGVYLVIIRLYNFRKTTQLVKSRREKFEIQENLKNSDKIDSVKLQIANLKTETDKLGETTWNLLKLQIWSFAFGIILGITYILIINNE